MRRMAVRGCQRWQFLCLGILLVFLVSVSLIMPHQLQKTEPEWTTDPLLVSPQVGGREYHDEVLDSNQLFDSNQPADTLLPLMDDVGANKDGCRTVTVVAVVGGPAAALEFLRLIKSVLQRRTTPLDVRLIVDEVARKSLEETFVTWLLPAVSLTYYNASTLGETVSWLPNKHYSGIYGLLKLVIPDILPSHVKTAVVLDTDLVFLGDIEKLASSLDGRECAVGMVENQSNWYKRTDAWPAVGPGFNSGVLVLNVERLRQLGWKQIWTARAKELLPVHLVLQLADQDIFNAVSVSTPGMFCNLSCYFNVQFSDSAIRSRCPDLESSFVVHWNTPNEATSLDLIEDADFAARTFRNAEQLNGYVFRSSWAGQCPSVHADAARREREADENIVGLTLNDVDCDDFVRQLRFEYRVYPDLLGFLSLPRGETSSVIVTLAVQLSLDRAYMLEIIAANYEGPISISIYISDFDAPSFIDFVKSSNVLSARSDIAYHIVFKYGTLYPVNKLRNVALAQVVTPYALSLDVDFVPSPEMARALNHLLSSAQKYGKFNKTAFVIPAFELASVAWASAELGLPSVKGELRAMVQNGSVRQFNLRKWPQGHAATNYARWFEAGEPYEVRWEQDYEPYLVVRLGSLPPFDEGFSGFGWNKVSHVMSLAQSGYRFVVLPNVWIVHIPHPPSSDIRRYRSSLMYRKCMKWFKADFVKRLMKGKRLITD